MFAHRKALLKKGMKHLKDEMFNLFPEYQGCPKQFEPIWQDCIRGLWSNAPENTTHKNILRKFYVKKNILTELSGTTRAKYKGYEIYHMYLYTYSMLQSFRNK